MRVIIAINPKKQLPVRCGSSKMLFAVKMGIVFYNSFFQRLLACTGVEFAKGFRIEDVTANVFHT
jgi:hypothetical protein